MSIGLKRFLALFLSCLMLLVLVACNDTEDITEGNETTDSTDAPVIEVTYADDFSVSKVFGDNMVLQRNQYIRVWGFAPESENGKAISASFMDMTEAALVVNGEWEIIFETELEANSNMGNSLKVYTDEKTVEFKDVLVGDVFMIIGQSNVQADINAHLSYEPAKERWSLDDLEENSLIRMNYNSNTDKEGYPTRGTEDVCLDVVTNNGWVIPDKENILRLTALGFFTAKEILELTDNKIPVGISQFSASGQTLSVFMPNHLAQELQSDRFDEAQGIYVGTYHSNIVARYMYNQYIKPYEKMPIAGIIWYQGEAESNQRLSNVYVERFTALMTYMRSTHNLINKDFPVFVIEFPTIYDKPADATEWNYLDTGVIRAVEGSIPLKLENSYFVSSSDTWTDKENTNNVHPYVKDLQAKKLASVMDAVIYGGRTLEEATGPILESYEFSSDRKTLTLKFKNVGEGLQTVDGGTVVKGISAVSKAGTIDNKNTVVAEITAPDTITATASKGLAGIGYHAIADYFYGVEINLCNSYGQAATAFWVFER